MPSFACASESSQMLTPILFAGKIELSPVGTPLKTGNAYAQDCK